MSVLADHAVARRLETAAAVVFLTGVVAQFAQHTDPTFPLLYFTVDSALLYGLLALVHALVPAGRVARAARSLVSALTPAVVFSGLVYATVIAPALNGGAWFAPGDDAVCRLAQMLLHGVGPALALVLTWADPAPPPPGRRAAWWLAWPLGYLVVVTATDVSPYAFLPPGAPEVQVAGVAAVLALVYGGVAWVCITLARAGRRRIDRVGASSRLR